MNDRYILDKDHRPVACDDLMEWAMWFENFEKRRVAQEYVKGCRVSTVFLGLDHNWERFINPDATPVLFETMIFDLPDRSEYQERCCTWEQALEMQVQAVAYARMHGSWCYRVLYGIRYAPEDVWRKLKKLYTVCLNAASKVRNRCRSAIRRMSSIRF